jgi:aldehyde:ferredoxin oxidoreductase
MFNLREGMTKDDDTLPPRFLNEPLEEGASKGHVVDLANMLPDYYRVRKWDKDGIPTQEKLEQLQINGVITL